MYRKIMILRFPKTEVDKPVVCNLARQFDLTFNILNAEIFPRKEGVMVLEIQGERKKFKKGMNYLKEQGVLVKSAGQEIKRNDEECTHCGACTAVCPTGALYVKRPEMTVEFDQGKCSICELCITACMSRVIKIRPMNQTFFNYS